MGCAGQRLPDLRLKESAVDVGFEIARRQRIDADNRILVGALDLDRARGGFAVYA